VLGFGAVSPPQLAGAAWAGGDHDRAAAAPCPAGGPPW